MLSEPGLWQGTEAARAAFPDAPNDIDMLEAADHGVIVRNDHGPGIPPFTGEARARIARRTRPGREGRAAAILDLTRGLKEA